jgi:molybdate transport system ATP-binding protein
MELRGIEITLGQFHFAIDVEISSGITGVFGPSGAGKTTLLEIIAGLRKPALGRQTLNGEVLFDAGKRIFVPAQARTMGYVPQDLALFPHLNVEENIRYGQRERGSTGSQRLFESICSVLEIGKNLAQLPGSLSGGEKQRVAFARALMTKPRFLMLDEPLTGLDQELKERVIPFILRMRHGFAVPMVYVTHSSAEIMALCDEVILLDRGKIAGAGKPSGLFEQSAVPAYRLRPHLITESVTTL